MLVQLNIVSVASINQVQKALILVGAKDPSYHPSTRLLKSF